MLIRIRVNDHHRIALAGAILLALLPGWLPAREPDAPVLLPVTQEVFSQFCATAVSGDREQTTLGLRLPDGTEWVVNLVAWGVPSFRIARYADGRSEREALSEGEAAGFATCIVESQGRYLWLTREMREMKRSVSGPFVTYHATDGLGYVRLLSRESEDTGLRDDPRFREQLAPRYMEHMMDGFQTMTYIGYEGGEIGPSPPPRSGEKPR